MPEETKPPEIVPPTPAAPPSWNVFAPAEPEDGEPRGASAGSEASRAWTPPTREEVGTLFPGYEVLRLLGRGGMGAVYQARQVELDRLVAIKLLPLEISVDKSFADRFRREAQAMARLQHPNIILVHDFGTTRQGHLYFVMEYVDGADLHDIIHQEGRSGGLDCDQALEIVEQVCMALTYAHGKGIIHRDIKPANVMVDARNRVKVADFGLARLLDAQTADLGRTVTGMVMGTPDYMAPEQMRSMNVDHRADIYSVGVMLYEMLCGEVPRGSFDKPSRRSGCDVRVDRIVTRATQQTPENRYQSTEQMKAQVAVVRAFGRSRKMRFRLTAFAVALALVAGAGLFSSHWFGAKTTGSPSASVQGPLVKELPAAKSGDNPPAVAAASASTPAAQTPPPAPPATAAMTREDQFNAAVKAAQEVGQKGDWGKTLEGWLRVVREYPEFPEARTNLEYQLKQLYERQPPISPEDFDAIRPQVAEAAKLSLPMAMVLLGQNVSKENPSEAMKLLSEAAAQGNAMAETELGIMLSNIALDDLAKRKAVEHLRSAADKGDARGITALGECYRKGFGVDKDPTKAAELYRKAADLGNADAMNFLGSLYTHGEGGLTKDLVKAFNYFKAAEEHGSREAKGNLGMFYLQGRGMAAPDPQKAVEIFFEGANTDKDAFCMLLYAVCLESGNGIKKNPFEANKWYHRAAVAGNEDAIKWCKKHDPP
jgi:serine/threonine protein kinase